MYGCSVQRLTVRLACMTAPFDRPTAIIIGSEGQGLSRLTRDKCDYIVSIPMRAVSILLNASNAAAVLLFEALRRRTQGN